MSILKQYNEETAAGTLSLDKAQIKTVEILDQLSNSLSKRLKNKYILNFKKNHKITKGIYLWGGVGSGKSMLMDKFFEASVLKNKTRVHFHSFMQQTHKSLNDLRKSGAKNPIDKIIKDITKKTDLLCFDELQITDITDAMLVGRLFEGLISSNVAIVITSNRIPDSLYKDGLNRNLFLPFISLIKDSLIIHKLNTNTDYRQRKLSTEVLYYSPINKESLSKINKLWNDITNGKSVKLKIEINDREFIFDKFKNGAARTSFNDLCGVPLGPADYLYIAEVLNLIIIENIPILSPSKANEAKRFITLIDSLYEARVRLICSAADIPKNLYPKGMNSFEFERTASRLIEMQSDEWGAQ
jgi:cell division protein ZapE